MGKNNCLLLIFPKKAIFIFIFSIIVVIFLTTVSKNTFANHFHSTNGEEIIQNLITLDTLFKENFEDGKLSRWKQISDWEVSGAEKISGLFSLKHVSNNSAGLSSIFHTMNVKCNQFDMEWSFQLKNGAWDPSAANRFWFYPIADTIQVDQITGWAVGVNLQGITDLLELWRIKKGKPDSLIIQTDLDWNASTLATITVRRSSQGKWELNYQKKGEAVSKIFTGTDSSTLVFKNTGLCFNFTVTRAGQLWMDNVHINARPAEIFVEKLSIPNSHSLTLTFSKPFDPSSLQINHFHLTDENSLDIPILKVSPTPTSNREVEIEVGKITGIQLNLQVSGVSDLSGLVMKPRTMAFPFSFLPEIGSVLINEVLFNPLTGGVDFVELVNVSKVPVSVHHLKLATRNDTLALKQIYALSTSARYLKPGHFITCTKDPKAVIPFYISNNAETFCQMASFPTFADASGTVVLINDSLKVIDELSYTEKMHSPFLTSNNGVSLERISLERPTSDKNNWTSCASSSGFATPGLPNSQAGTNTETLDQIIPDPVVFSPNGDGFNDLLTIHFNLAKPGYIANVRIFDLAARPVKYLVKNESLARQGSWTWEGDSDSGGRLNMGVYIILVELFDQGGDSKTFKKICTLTDRRR